jgi:hypothetical protein
MDIEELSKGQLLLLTLLVNFVMSVATGIVTVSLLDQASPTITQTVNRIVEQTVQTVAPASPVAAIATPTKTQPTQQEQIETAVADAVARTVTITSSDGATQIGTGTYLPKSRAVVTAGGAALPGQALITFANGSTSPVSLSHSGTSIAIYGFADSAILPAGPAVSLVASTTLKQGQAILAITGDGSAVTGIISKVSAGQITTTLPQTPAGAAAVDLSGNIIGINTGADGVYASADDIAALLSAPAGS